MKSLIAIAMLMFLSACASNQSIKTSGDIEGQRTIRVLGTGKTKDDAKRNGFRNAIEIVVGSAMVSEKEVINNRLRKNEIIEHSAGYVDDYKIVDTYPTNSGVSVVMDVTVKNSVIASKLLNRNDSTNINGDRLDTQYKTYMKERHTGDEFLESVLKDFPSRALTVKQGKVDYKLNGDRSTVFSIPYSVRWNYKYIQALNEALSKVQDTGSNQFFDPKCMCYISPERVVVMAKNPDDWVLGTKNVYHFNDAIRAKNIESWLSAKPVMKITFIGTNGQVLQKNCVGTETIFAGIQDRGLFAVWGNAVEEQNVNVHVMRGTPLYYNMNNLSRIDITMETVNQCNS